jgi:hypothetical protein
MIDEGARFYKYRSLATEVERQRVRQIVVESKVYFSPPKYFNDPFDLHPVFDLDAPRRVQQKEYERLARVHGGLGRADRRREARQVMKTTMRPENVRATAAEIQERHARALAESVGVLCLSTKPNDILMWSHYGDSHRGVCLEFDGHSQLVREAQQVMYRPVREPIRPYSEDKLQMMEKALLTKSDRWSYESEYRLLRYRSGPGLVEFDPTALIGIILGANADLAIYTEVSSWITARGSNVPLKVAGISETAYEIVIQPCTAPVNKA